MFLASLLAPPTELLRRADAAQADGQLPAAVDLLRRAYKRIRHRGDFFHAEVFTRLPLMLQESGESTLAWTELCQLLEKGCPGTNRHCHPATRWLDSATIFDKMRLFLQREGEWDLAVLCGIQYYRCRYHACLREPKLGKTGPMRSHKAIQCLLAPLLNKANKAHLLDAFTVAVHEALRDAQPLAAPDALMRQLGQWLDEGPSRATHGRHRFALPRLAKAH